MVLWSVVAYLLANFWQVLHMNQGVQISGLSSALPALILVISGLGMIGEVFFEEPREAVL